MNRVQTKLTVMSVFILCISLALLLGCSKKAKIESTSDWLTQMRQSINMEVKDPERAAQIMEVLATVDTDLNNWNSYQTEYQQNFLKLNANYDVSREEFRTFIATYNSNRHQMKESLIEARFKIKGFCTEDEWEKISELEKTLFQQWWSENNQMTHLVIQNRGEVVS